MVSVTLRAVALGLAAFLLLVRAGSERAELPGNEASVLAFAAALPTVVAAWTASVWGLAMLCRLRGPVRGITVRLLHVAIPLGLVPLVLFGALDPSAETLGGLLTAHLRGVAVGGLGVVVGGWLASRPPPAQHHTWSWLTVAAAAVVALAWLGEGPAETRINLPLGDFSLQLLELVPFALALSLLGLWSATQEGTLGPPSWLAWCAATLVMLLTTTEHLDDKGAALVVLATLALVATWLFDVGRWVSPFLLGLLAVGAAVLVGRLGALHDGSQLALRLAMRADPWWNGLSNGEQLAMALATVENGGWSGVATWWMERADLPVASSDFVLPLLAGAFGFPAAILWIACWWRACTTFFVASTLDDQVFPGARRAPAAVAAALVAKLVVASWGPLGVAPMTGVCAPLLAAGDTALCVAWFFLGYALAHVNAPAEGTTVRGRHPVARTVLLVTLLLLPAVGVLAERGTAAQRGDDHAGWVTRDEEGNVVFREVPLLARVSRQLVRQTLLDVNAEILATSTPGGGRLRDTTPEMGDMIGNPGDLDGTLESTLGTRWPRATLPPATGAHPGRDLRSLRAYTRMSPAEFRAATAAVAAVTTGVDRRLSRRLAPLLSAYAERVPGTVATVLVLRDAAGRILSELVYRAPHLEGARFHDVPNLASGLRVSPASQLKVLVAAAADVYGIPRDTELSCAKRPDGRGFVRVCSGDGCQVIRDFPRGRHAERLSIAQGIECSCNAANIELALRVDHAVLASMYAEVADTLPPDLSNPHLHAETAIGQGVAELSPEQVSTMMLALGTDGVLRPGQLGALPADVPARRLVPAATAEWTTALMDGVVNGEHGTAKGARLAAPLRAAGKTGTAQATRRADDPHQGDHGWFTAIVRDDSGAAYVATFLAVHGDAPGGTWAQSLPPLVEALVAEGYLRANRDTAAHPRDTPVIAQAEVSR